MVRPGEARESLVLQVCVLIALLLLAGIALLPNGPSGQTTGGRSLLSPSVAPQAAEVPARHSGKSSREPSGSAFDAKDLEGRLRKIAASHQGVYGMVVYDPASGKTAKVNADEVFGAASIGKLPALISLYKAAERGEADLDANISIRVSDVRSYGSGVLHKEPVGATMTLRRCAYYLMNHSDNTAWVMLDRYLGREYIQAGMEDIGADSTLYLPPNTTPPEDVLLMLRRIADPSFTSDAASAEMLRFMTNTDLEDRIPAGLPPGARVAHKYGSYGTSFGDAGVVFFREHGKEKHYFIVVLSDGAFEADAREVMQQAAGAAHREISGSAGNMPDGEQNRRSVKET